MHGEADNGYAVAPVPGFAPFVITLQRYAPWADERLRCGGAIAAAAAAAWASCSHCVCACVHVRWHEGRHR